MVILAVDGYKLQLHDIEEIMDHYGCMKRHLELVRPNIDFFHQEYKSQWLVSDVFTKNIKVNKSRLIKRELKIRTDSRKILN